LNQSLHEALRSCDAAIGANPNDATAHLNRGIVLHAMKRFSEALASHERAIALEPGLADAHFGRGNALWSMSRPNEALEAYDRGITLRPGYAEAHYNRANALKAMKRPEESLESYDRAIAARPDHALAYNNRGNLLREMGRAEEAIQSYERAIAVKPDLAQAHYNRGEALLRAGRAAQAFEGFSRTVALSPRFAEAWYKRGDAAGELGRRDEALRNYDRAVALKPDLAAAWNNRGNLLRHLGQLEQAIESYSRAIDARKDYALAHNNRNIAFGAQGNLARALEDCERAIALDAAFAEAHYNKGNVLKAQARFPEAIASYDRAIALRPEFGDAWWNKGVTTLLMGDFEAGWPLYEWRSEKPGVVLPPCPEPMWTGRESLEGKTLLIMAEQGLGDTIQFARYAALAEARGAKVVFAVQDRLKRLLGQLEGSVRIAGVTDPLGGFDFCARLMSLPLLFETRLDNIPARVPYLRAEPDRIEPWKHRIGSRGFKIGISWQGAPEGEIDVGRSFPVRRFERLAGMRGVRLISLQKNTGVEQLSDLPAGMKVETPGDDFDAGPDAFIDSAAVMESLDLVITSDTAVAHLAGALGKPVWVALGFVPDWRWLLDRSDSPWYPTMTLFRQSRRSDWSTVFAEMESRLREIAESPLSGAVRTAPRIPVSWGELIDKITILEIKSERIDEKDARANVQKELAILRAAAEPVLVAGGETATLKRELRSLNEKLWQTEDSLREKEAKGVFDAEFVELARSVYRHNDERAALKRRINLELGSELREEKIYGSKPSAPRES
jgi:tetratricopeptide (TPR) repeat protein